MVVPGRLKAAIGVLLLALWGGAARASGPSATAPWYLDEYGGEPADLKTFYGGRVGIVMPTAPRPMLYISWRLLHGQKVGPAAGDALSTPCCGGTWWDTDFKGGTAGWIEARKIVTGETRPGAYIRTDREGPNYRSTPNCFDEAFDKATATLKDRAARYGARSADVAAWLAGQDAVFRACHDAGVVLPPMAAAAPAWLRADHAYQDAALALYDGRNGEAAAKFEAIAHDAGSPWRGFGLYLSARALVREALAQKTPATYGAARGALARLAATPPDTFGRSQARGLENAVEFRERPQAFLARTERILAQDEPAPDIASVFRDFSEIGDLQAAKPDPLDWMATMKARPQGPGEGVATETPAQQLERYRRLHAAALAHAEARWRAGHDVAWLIAALSLADPGAPQAEALVKDARAVPAASPAWLSAQYHVARLTLRTAPPAASRAHLDAILQRRDLSLSDRNVFLALRTQVAADLDDFVRHALRRRLCADMNINWEVGTKPTLPACARLRWDNDEVQPAGIYDGVGGKGNVGLGEDARAIIDRAPLATRIAIGADTGLPPALRLDVALTSYGRAVALQDDAAIDKLASQLAVLLPLVATEFRGVVAARPGADKRFAEFLVLAKIPGVRIDLPGAYIRPEGSKVADFQSHWADWIVMPNRAWPQAGAPILAAYQQDGAGATVGFQDDPATPDGLTDLSCLGECGRGAAPLRLPDFVAAGQARATVERSRFVTFEEPYYGRANVYPPGGVSAWDEMLDYARAHRADPRVPEALHWLVHVGHFGGSHNHSGHRAFSLLHGRYPNSIWARRTPVYND